MSLKQMQTIATAAKEASYKVSGLSKDERNRALQAMADALVKDADLIVKANAKDLARAKKAGLSGALIGRLTLTADKVKKMAQGLEDIMRLPDPLGRVLETTKRPNGMSIRKVSTPLGVILIIFESRPNVTADCAGLCLKSGNSVILRGGKEAFDSNFQIHQTLIKPLKKLGIPKAAVSFVNTTDRADVGHLLQMTSQIDVVIPRGGESLIHAVSEQSKIPVIKHYHGVCHTYVDKDADLAMAVDIAENAKVQNPGVCNAMETLLVHESVAGKFLPEFAKRLAGKVELRGDAATKKILPKAKTATEKDWSTEYLDYVLSVRVLSGVDEAIAHIRKYGSQHSDCIVSKNAATRERFVKNVDSACVFENVSTRFNDGGEFGMGAEMGISTDKLHARGPVGIRELTTYKYIVQGSGQVRK